MDWLQAILDGAMMVLALTFLFLALRAHLKGNWGACQSNMLIAIFYLVLLK